MKSKGLRKKTASSCFSASSAEADAARQKHVDKVRATLRKIDDPMLRMLDAFKEQFGDGVKLEGLQAPQDGRTAGMGRLGPGSDLEPHWPAWTEPQR